MSDAVLVFIIFILIILCAGEPDLIDVIIYHLSDGTMKPDT